MMYCFIHQIKSRQSTDGWRVNWMDYDCKNAPLRFRLTPLWNNSHFVHWQFILLFTFDITWFRKVSWVMLPLHTRKHTSMYKQLKYIELVWHPSFYGHSSITTTNKAKSANVFAVVIIKMFLFQITCAWKIQLAWRFFMYTFYELFYFFVKWWFIYLHNFSSGCVIFHS